MSRYRAHTADQKVRMVRAVQALDRYGEMHRLPGAELCVHCKRPTENAVPGPVWLPMPAADRCASCTTRRSARWGPNAACPGHCARAVLRVPEKAACVVVGAFCWYLPPCLSADCLAAHEAHGCVNTERQRIPFMGQLEQELWAGDVAAYGPTLTHIDYNHAITSAVGPALPLPRVLVLVVLEYLVLGCNSEVRVPIRGSTRLHCH